MDLLISHSSDLSPFDLRMIVLEIFGNILCGLADHF